MGVHIFAWKQWGGRGVMFLALPHIAEATVAPAHLVVGARRIGGVRVGVGG